MQSCAELVVAGRKTIEDTKHERQISEANSSFIHQRLFTNTVREKYENRYKGFEQSYKMLTE
jgi:hypothetical protein